MIMALISKASKIRDVTILKLPEAEADLMGHAPLVKPGPLGATSGTMGQRRTKLLKPGQVLAGALTVAPVLVVLAPESHLGHHWLMITTINGLVHPSFIQARYSFYSWVCWGGVV